MAKEPNDQAEDLRVSPLGADADDPQDPSRDADLHDISKLQLNATSGKTLLAAGRMLVTEASSDARNQAQREHEKRETQEARELANLARWNAEKTTVGGVQMTNEQAQNARQNIIDNGDAYADWAVRKGLIKDDEKDEFKAAVRRKKELEEKRGRGTLTAAEAEEAERLSRSRVGQAIDAATAYDHQQKGVAPSAEAKRPDADRELRGSAGVVDRGSLFQSAPDVGAAFEAVRTNAPEKKAATPPAVSPTIQATGLDL